MLAVLNEIKCHIDIYICQINGIKIRNKIYMKYFIELQLGAKFCIKIAC